MKKKIVSIVICMLMCATVVSVAGNLNTNSNSKAFKAATDSSSSNSGTVWLQANNAIKETASFSTDWIHYDDGTCENSLGLTAGGTIHEVIVLTPTELAGYSGAFTSIKVMHGCPLYPGCPATPYTAWMYTNVNHPAGDPTSVATIVGTGTCPAIDNWFYINLTTPYPFSSTDTVWIGVAWTQPASSYPAGFDTSGYVAGKSDWLWYVGGAWYELNGIGYPGNWNLWVGVGSANQPPATPAAPTGPTSGQAGVTYSFNATTTDPEGDNISYMFDWGDGNTSGWLGPYASGAIATGSYAWGAAGNYNVKVKARDTSNAESGWSANHAIVIAPAGPTIAIQNITGGLLKVKTEIKNTGASTVTNIDWSIALNGGVILLGKNTTGTITSILPGGSVAISSKMIIGFGATVITVKASTISKTQDAKVLLFYIKIV